MRIEIEEKLTHLKNEFTGYDIKESDNLDLIEDLHEEYYPLMYFNIEIDQTQKEVDYTYSHSGEYWEYYSSKYKYGPYMGTNEDGNVNLNPYNWPGEVGWSASYLKKQILETRERYGDQNFTPVFDLSILDDDTASVSFTSELGITVGGKPLCK